MKKLLVLFLVGIMVLSFTACGIPAKPDNMRQEFYDIVKATLDDIELCLDEKMSPNRLGERVEEYYEELEEIDKSEDTIEENAIRESFYYSSLRDDEELEIYQVEGFKQSIIDDLNSVGLPNYDPKLRS